MTGQTDHYGLSTFGPGDSLSDNGFKILGDDRKFEDQLLYLGAEGHKHNGASSSAAAATDTLTLALHTSGGSIPASTRLFYKYAYVDNNGLESAASTEYFIDTPAAIASPNAPTLTTLTTGGTLLPGVYYYTLTAYTGTNTNETKSQVVAYITVPVTTSTNKIVLEYPSLPSGADGWNIYRRKPGGPRYGWLTSVAAGPATYNDTGGITEDCNRTVPVANKTNAANSIQLTLPTLTPGLTWVVYRSFVTGQYDNGLLHHVVEETFTGSGIITPTFTDVGNATLVGSPRAIGQSIGSPSEIQLQDAVEVQGHLPMGNVSGFPVVIQHNYTGLTATSVGTRVFPIEFPQATVVGCRATLGDGAHAASTDVIVDVNLHRGGATPINTTIYTTDANRPKITVGNQMGTRTVPNIKELVVGDYLTIDVDQAGGGSTPTDFDLTVTIYLYAYGWTEVSHVWS